MKRFLIIVLAILIVGALIVGGCAAPASPTTQPAPAAKPAATTHAPVKLDVWGGAFGGTIYVTGFAFMDSLNKSNHPWLSGSIIETKGSWDNVLNSDKDKAKMPYAVITSDYGTLPNIQNGVAKTWKDAGRSNAVHGDRLVVAAISNSAQIFVTLNPDIKRGKDLAGKRVAGWTRGSGAYPNMVVMFEEWGITEKDLKSYDGMELKAKVDALRDGLVDAVMMAEPFIAEQPNLMSANMSELVANPKPLYFVPVLKEEYDSIAPKYKARNEYLMPWKEIPAGHWVKNWSKWGANFVTQVFWVYKEMPEDIQYEIAKVLIEKSDDIAAHGGQAGVLIPSAMVGNLPITSEAEMAPGALKYYKEKGLWTKYKPALLK